MELRDFGKRFQVPVYGQGTWNLFGKGVVEALRKGIDLGLTHIDTAEMYGTEESVGEAIAGRRDEVFLVSKVLPSNASRTATIRACDQSLIRLRTDRLDCYLLHWPGRHPLEETIAAFEELVAKGKIRSYGVSNFDEDLLAQALKIAGPGKIACNQCLYNLEERHLEARVLPFCRKNGIALVGYSPIKGIHGPEIEKVAKEIGATAAQVALAFLTRLEGTFAIPKASTLAHVRENARRLALSAEQIARLDKAYPLRVRAELPTA
ncbi:MAG: aldo/keto reductase [Myxococcales bacterium]|nr:aldo/keto reductase [Myxococcales bacterium]